jgi:hypothetical protein
MDNPKIKVHIHDNTRVPDGQKCLAEHELERGKVTTLHMHDGPCDICPQGHCHHGSIAIAIGLNGDLMIAFEGLRPPERITFDDFRPKTSLHQEGASTNARSEWSAPSEI